MQGNRPESYDGIGSALRRGFGRLMIRGRRRVVDEPGDNPVVPPTPAEAAVKMSEAAGHLKAVALMMGNGENPSLTTATNGIERAMKRMVGELEGHD